MAPKPSNKVVHKADLLAEPWSYEEAQEEEQKLAEMKLASASACCSPLQIDGISNWAGPKQESKPRQPKVIDHRRQVSDQEMAVTTSTETNTAMEDDLDDGWDVKLAGDDVEIVLSDPPQMESMEGAATVRSRETLHEKNRGSLKLWIIACIILALVAIVIVISTLLARQKKENENDSSSPTNVARTAFPPDVIDTSEGTVLGSFEAEDAVLSNAYVSTNSTGFLGDGYVAFDDKEESFIEWNIDIPLEGTYALELRYAAAESLPLDLIVDGNEDEAHVYSYDITSTKSSTRWRTERQDVEIASAGQHSFRLSTTGGSEGPNIDRLTVFQMPFRLQASEASRYQDAELDTLYPSFSGQGYASYLAEGGYVEWRVTFPETGDYLTSVRYASTEDRPLDLYVKGEQDELKVSFSALQTLGWSHWLKESHVLSFDKGEHTIQLRASENEGPNVDWIQFLSLSSGGDQQGSGGVSSPGQPSTGPPPSPTSSPPGSPDEVPTASPPSSPASAPNNSEPSTPGPTASVNTFSAILQAEDAPKIILAQTRTIHDGFSGRGYIDYDGEGGLVEWTLDVPVEDLYTISARYASAAAVARPVDLNVNGETVQEYSFQPTGARWSDWSSESHNIRLSAGRNVIQLAATNSGGPNIDFLSVTPSYIPPLDDNAILDVLIVGGGWAGIAAADSLRRNGVQDFEIFEARDYVGGRSRTVYDIHPEVATELGSAWIYPGTGVHDIVDNSGVNYVGTTLDYEQDFALFQSGDNWSNGRLSTSYKMTLINNNWMSSFVPYSTSRADDLWWADSDAAYETVLQEYFRREGLTAESSFERQFINAMVQQELSLEYGAPYEFVSTVSIGDSVGGKYSGLLNYLNVAGGGYDKVLKYVSETMESRIRKNHEVKTINYLNEELVEVTYTDDQGQAQTKYARTVLVTVPLGVLKARRIQFIPELPRSKTNAIDYIGFGSLNKIVLYWEDDQGEWWPNDRFWTCLITDRDDTSGMWTSYYNERNADTGGRYILTGWIGGNASIESESDSDEDTLNIVMQNLNDMFGGLVPTPTKYIITRWGQDEHAGGAYSYSPPGPGDEVDRARNQLASPINNRIFFAGEATDGGWYGTTEGAYRSGNRAADEIRRAL
jgi:monoamine oxidase